VRGSALAFLVVALNVSDARAAPRPLFPEGEASGPSAATPGTSQDNGPHVLGTFDTLGVIDGRYGVQVEWVPAPHWGIAAYGWWEHSTLSGAADVVAIDSDTIDSTETHAYGLDTQVRYYFSESPALGFFIAPGVEVQRFDTNTTIGCTPEYGEDPCPTTNAERRFDYLGLSFDIGLQTIIPILPHGLVGSVSIGAQERTVLAGAVETTEMPWMWNAVDGPGLRPRLRLSVGWAL
jgi:hypothetical protein